MVMHWQCVLLHYSELCCVLNFTDFIYSPCNIVKRLPYGLSCAPPLLGLLLYQHMLGLGQGDSLCICLCRRLVRVPKRVKHILSERQDSTVGQQCNDSCMHLQTT